MNKMNLAAQPYWIDSCTATQSITVGSPYCWYGGLAPIGCWSGYQALDWFPYRNYLDAANQFSDLTRIASKLELFTGANPGTFLDQGQLIKIDYSKVQYMIRNNGNIALNLRTYHISPKRAALSLPPTNFYRFSQIMNDSLDNAGGTVSAFTASPLTRPTDFPWFNKYFKITKSKNIRLLPGEMKYISEKTCLGKVMQSSSLNTTFLKPYTKIFGFTVNGDPVHSSEDELQVTLSGGKLDIVASYKLKFRRLEVPAIQNEIFQDINLEALAVNVQEHVAAFANVANPVDF